MSKNSNTGGARSAPANTDSGGDGNTPGVVKGTGPGSANPPVATAATDDGFTETENEGFTGHPGLSDAEERMGEFDPLTRASTVLAQASQQQRNPNRPRNAVDMPVTRNYANEAFIDEMVDANEACLDMMAPNVDSLLVRVQMPDTFREFTSQMEYEKFMHEPMVVRIHESKDKNDPPLVFIGVNGDTRWAPRGRNLKLPRKLIERLAQAQEMTFQTIESNDPRADSMMQTVRRTAASYSFSVLHDPNPVGRQWLRRITREGT